MVHSDLMVPHALRIIHTDSQAICAIVGMTRLLIRGCQMLGIQVD
jgi:hypothetical protein